MSMNEWDPDVVEVERDCTCGGHTNADYPHSMFDLEVPHDEDCPAVQP